MRDFRDAKLMAKALRQALADRDVDLSHSETLEIVARQFGFDQWNILSAKLEQTTASPPAVGIEPPIPIFRICDVDKAKEFYCGFLGFELDWEHRFGEHFPLRDLQRRTRIVVPARKSQQRAIALGADPADDRGHPSQKRAIRGAMSPLKRAPLKTP